MKRALPLLLSAFMLITTLIMPAYAAPKGEPFKDMKGYEWAEEAVSRMSDKGILKGTGNGFFNPQKPVTWGEALIMFVRALGLEDEALNDYEIPSELKGIKIDKDLLGYVAVAYENGLLTLEEVQGVSLNAPVKRVDAAKLVVRALGLEGYVDDEYDLRDIFSDINEINADDIPYIYIAYIENIINGIDGKFVPEKPLTRAEMSVILDRLFSRLGDVIPLPAKRPSVTDKCVYISGRVTGIDKNNNTLIIDVENQELPDSIASKNMREIRLSYRTDAQFFDGEEYNDIKDIKIGEYVSLVVFKSQIIFAAANEDTTSYGELKLEAVDLEDVPDGVINELEDIKEEGGYKAFKDGDTYYLLAAAGEKPTGGYSISIYGARSAEDGSISVFVTERSPKAGDMVTQVITYPYDIKVIKPAGEVKEIRFLDSRGNILKTIEF
ncbi:S-layer homology domain-containing protein [Calorimonas adulescens]|uniref:Protease complex subunit PrcB family protein n=1 Tax=Calorimonas adulescens TaxID=2606906 RepID=A0A5D8QFD5_9THEO|nr:S-layer homology domain-containing protein [Calorimonas adulescens]TZE83137.1 protease complex subunit PrcB family protein [Calorimonas adulescens]